MRLRPRRLDSHRARFSAAAGAALLGLAGSGFTGVASSAAAAAPRPAILGFAATPKQLTSDGGAVRLSVRVKNARTCTFRGQGAPFSAYNRTTTVRCASGRATATLTVAANPRALPATIHYVVRATANGRSVQKALTIVEAAAQDAGTVAPPAAPPTISTTSLPGASVGDAYTVTLAATGGTEPYSWSVTHGTLPAGLALAPSGAITGTPSGTGTATFTVTVTDAAQQSASVSLSLAVRSVVLPVNLMERSTNWSGYVLEPGPFTSVTGTFNVPSLTNLSGQVNDSMWVGIDGNSNDQLIQAGVAESYSPFTGTEVHAWWEILPAPETRIETLTIQPGDSVTATIQQVSPGTWSITVADNTSGQSFSITQSYTGPTTSAEWIVEAPQTGSGRQLTLGAYVPNVTFTGLGWTGPATQFTPIQMTDGRGGAVISIPSDLNGDQTSFQVAYGSTAPPVPG